MTNHLDENRPQSCYAVGLECQSCVERSAKDVAMLCRGLGDAAAERMFVQIFTDPECGRMSAHFVAVYRRARMDDDTVIPRIGPAIETRRWRPRQLR
jgi:hypothetical protein